MSEKDQSIKNTAYASGVVDVTALAETKGKILAVDYGDVRTGIATSDEGRRFAFGNTTISVGGAKKTAGKVAELVKEKGAVAVVIGHPVNMNGTLGPRSEKAVAFARLLSGMIPDVPVALFDERMTTMAASRYLNETNTRGQKRKGVIDTLSAEIILQNVLDRLGSISGG